MRIRVLGMGPVGGFGAGSGDLIRALQGEFIPEPCKMDNGKAGPRWFRADDSRVREFFPPGKLRRMDHFSCLALLAASLAVQDAGPLDPDSTGLIVASAYGASRTTFGFKDSFLDRGDRLSMPTLFSNSVHNAAAAHISTLLGIRGPCLTVSQFDLSMTSAVYTAVQWLEEGRTGSVLVGAVDEYTDLAGRAAELLTGDSVSPRVSGEGGCFFLLSGDGHGGYAVLSDPVMDHRDRVLETDDSVIMGALGYGCCKDKALGQYPSYVSMYGSFPASAALDMAVACLSLKNRVLYSPGSHESLPSAGGIKCIKPGNGSLWGAVSLQI